MASIDVLPEKSCVNIVHTCPHTCIALYYACVLIMSGQLTGLICTDDKQWSIVYKDSYNIGFMGLEKIHPFDAGKWGKIHKRLVSESIMFQVL